jgi:hypothetical protein
MLHSCIAYKIDDHIGDSCSMKIYRMSYIFLATSCTENITVGINGYTKAKLYNENKKVNEIFLFFIKKF